MKKQKKQSLLTTIIIILAIALAMLVGSIVYEETININKQETQGSNSTTEDENNVTPETEKEPIQNEQEETSTEDEEFVGEEEQEDKAEDTSKSNDEKAIDLAKKEWGEDDSVTFSVEEKKGTKYYVAVKSDASVMAWYEVDTETWEISEF